MKPRIFIGSSKETLDIAYAVQELMESDAEVTVWKQGIFELSSYTLESLINSFANFDFALFVFAPTDVTRMRGTQQNSIRDNVIFELGLFIGHLGRKRCFIILPQDKKLHLPTDLEGITCATYSDRNDGNLIAALGPATNKIRRAIEQQLVTAQTEDEDLKKILNGLDVFIEKVENIEQQLAMKKGKGEGFSEIRQGLDHMVKKIEDTTKKPNLILAFERSAAFVATALAQRLNVQEILVFNRLRMENSQGSVSTDAGPQIGNGLSVDPEWFNTRVPIIAKYGLITGQNLEAGFSFLKSQGIESIPPVFTLYISKIGKQRWPQVSWVYDHRDIESAFELMPWIDGKYPWC